jgi:integrase
VSGLHTAVDDYLATRRALGYKLEKHDWLLHDFAGYCDRAGADRVTTELALAWATRPAGAHPMWHSHRLGVVRVFARYQHALDPRTEVPPAGVLDGRRPRSEPYLYTRDDVAALQAAARTLTTPLRAATYDTLVGLLAVTGMRVGEAIRLDRADLDPAAGLLTIRQTKFGKSRRLPVHASTTAALQAYGRVRDTLCPTPPAPAFFVSLAGTRLIYSNVQDCFARLARKAGLAPQPGRRGPRIHDLRHSFAVATVTRWYRDGLDAGARLYRLSTYLGHTDPSSTYWYYSDSRVIPILAPSRA